MLEIFFDFEMCKVDVCLSACPSLGVFGYEECDIGCGFGK
jgi:hypothetical protein